MGHKGLLERRSQASSRPRGRLPGATEEPAWHRPNSIVSLVPRTPWQDVAIFPWTDTEVPRMHDWQGEVASRPDPVCPLQSPVQCQSSRWTASPPPSTGLDRGPPSSQRQGGEGPWSRAAETRRHQGWEEAWGL